MNKQKEKLINEFIDNLKTQNETTYNKWITITNIFENKFKNVDVEAVLAASELWKSCEDGLFNYYKQLNNLLETKLNTVETTLLASYIDNYVPKELLDNGFYVKHLETIDKTTRPLAYITSDDIFMVDKEIYKDVVKNYLEDTFYTWESRKEIGFCNNCIDEDICNLSILCEEDKEILDKWIGSSSNYKNYNALIDKTSQNFKGIVRETIKELQKNKELRNKFYKLVNKIHSLSTRYIYEYHGISSPAFVRSSYEFLKADEKGKQAKELDVSEKEMFYETYLPELLKQLNENELKELPSLINYTHKKR